MDKLLFFRHSPARGLRPCLIGISLCGFAAGVAAGTIADAPLSSYPPGPHNVLLILDNSNRMDLKYDGSKYVGAADATSKSEIARKAVEDLLAKYTDQPMVRLGLLAYNPSIPTTDFSGAPLPGTLNATSGSVGGTSPYSAPTAWYYSGTSQPELGYLQSPIQSVTSASVSTLNNLLANNVPNSFGIATSSGIKNAGGSPVSGALYTAYTYLNGNSQVSSACDTSVALLTGSKPDTRSDGKTAYTSASYPPAGISLSSPLLAPASLGDAIHNLSMSDSHVFPYIVALPDPAASTQFLPAPSVPVAPSYLRTDTNSPTASRPLDQMAIAIKSNARVSYTRTNSQSNAQRDLAAALDRIMAFTTYSTPYMLSLNPSSSSPTANGTTLQDHTLIFQAQATIFYDMGWGGNLQAYPIDPLTGQVKVTTSIDPDTGLQVQAKIAKWDASAAPKLKPGAGNLWASRLIYSYDPQQKKGVVFQWTDSSGGKNRLNDSQRAALAQGFDNLWNASGGSNDYPSSPSTDQTNLGNRLVNYLKGQSTFERGYTAGTNVPYFNNTTLQQVSGPRLSLLGDIVNSDPAYVSAENFAYDVLSEGADLLPNNSPNPNAYRNFLNYKNTRKRVIYVGANDGMLHGFDAGTYPFSGADANIYGTGDEVFAYVPSAVIGPRLANLAKLADPWFRHYYLVDGSPSVADAYLNNAKSVNGWNTVLVGTTGAGGKSIFALDVTCPVASVGYCPSASISESRVMWEISDSDDGMSVWWKKDRDPYNTSSDDLSSACTPAGCPDASKGQAKSVHGDLGYTLPKASIVRMNDGSWAVVVANGYNSANGHAVLFILRLSDGAVIKKIDTGIGGTSADKNGLSTPIAVDTDGNRTADYIYAGDLLGNLWKFDISGSDSSNWALGNGGAPLFVACASGTCSNINDKYRQPITAKPIVGPGPVFDQQNSGVMLYVGTGKYFEINDNYVPSSPTPRTETFYGLWDNNNGAIVRGNLQRQAITQTTTVNGTAVRMSENNPVTYSNSGSTQRGWFMDLGSGTGERVTANAKLDNGHVLFETLIPTNSCSYPGGESWIMELNALDGSPLADTTIPSGMKAAIGIVTAPIILSNGDGTSQIKVFVGSGSGGQNLQIINSSGSSAQGAGNGRTSWRQLP